MSDKIKLIDNASLKGREEKFTLMKVNLKKVIADWQDSLFSFEWLEPDGTVRSLKTLSADRTEQYQKIESLYKNNGALERPVLGLGMMDNVEIGSRKEVLLTLYKLGVSTLEVHVPKTCSEDFQKLM